MRDELLNSEIFYTAAEARTLIEAWRRHYNAFRSHNWLGYRPQAPDSDAAIADLRFRFARPIHGNGARGRMH